MTIRLTDDARARWLKDDARRVDAGRDKSGAWILPARGIGEAKVFEVEFFETPGRAWVRCPNFEQGFAPLMLNEIVFTENENHAD